MTLKMRGKICLTLFLLSISIILIFTLLSEALSEESKESKAQVEALIAKFKSVNWDSRAKESKKRKEDDAWKIRLEVERDLVAQGNAAISPLILGLSDENRHVRALAAYVLGVVGNAESSSNLQKTLESDPDATVRIYAAEALGRISQQKSVNIEAEYAKAKVKADFASAIVGQPAPDFSLMSTEGERVQLSLFKETQNLILIFTVGDWSEKCNRMLSDIKGLYQNIRSRNAEVIVVNPQELGITSEWQKKLSLLFLMLSDPTGLVGAVYGVSKQLMVKEMWVNLPAAFIVDKKGILRFAYIGKSIDDRISVIALIKELDKWKK